MGVLSVRVCEEEEAAKWWERSRSTKFLLQENTRIDLVARSEVLPASPCILKDRVCIYMRDTMPLRSSPC